MASYIIHLILRGQASQGGKVGAGGCVVSAPNPTSAKEIGAAQLGVTPSEVTATPYDNPALGAVIQTRPGFPPPESDDDIEVVYPEIAREE
jgi:hypothetical protein